MTNILIVTRGFFHPWIGGVASYARGLAEGILEASKSRKDLRVAVTSSVDPDAKPDLVETRNYLSINPIELRLNSTNLNVTQRNTLSQNSKFFRNSHPDIIHVVFDGLDPLLVKSRTPLSKDTFIIKHLFIYPIHPTFFAERFYFSFLEKIRLWESINVIMSHSDEAIRHLYRLRKTVLLSPVVDTDYFRPMCLAHLASETIHDSMKKAKVVIGDLLTVLSHEILLFYMGPLTEGRFPANSISECVSKLKTKFLMDVGLVAIGRGFEESGDLAKIVNIVKKNNIENNVFVCMKVLTDTEKIYFFNRSTIFLNLFVKDLMKKSVVLPPMVVLEGMAIGKTVVVGGLPSFENLVINRHNGILIENTLKGEEIAVEIWNGLTQLKNLGSNARAKIENCHSVKSFSHTYLEFLDMLLS